MQNSFQTLQFLPFHGDDVEVKMDIRITQFIRLVQVPLKHTPNSFIWMGAFEAHLPLTQIPFLPQR